MPKRELVDDIRMQLHKNSSVIENIRKRSTHMLSATGLIFAGYVGFLGLATLNPMPHFAFSIDGVAFGFMITSVPFLIAALWLFAYILFRPVQDVSIITKSLIRECCGKYKIHDEMLDKWIKYTQDEYYDKLIGEYMPYIKDARETVNRLKMTFTFAIILFSFGISVFMISLLVMSASSNLYYNLN